MTGAERAKYSRINAKEWTALTTDDHAFLVQIGKKWREKMAVKPPADKPPPAPKPPVAPIAPSGEENAPAPLNESIEPPPTVVKDETWDRVIDATGDSADDDDDDDGEEAVDYDKTAIAKTGEKPEPMSLTLAAGTVGSYFLLQQSMWSIFGDRDPKYLAPTDEETKLLSGIVSRYAERWGWTRELDDAILFTTVMVVTNTRAFKAPKKTSEKK